MKRVQRVVASLTIGAILAGCATTLPPIPITRAAPDRYRGYGCEQIAYELRRVDGGLITRRAGDERRDEVAAALAVVGVVVMLGLLAAGGVPFGGIGGFGGSSDTPEARARLERLRGEHAALTQAAFEQRCTAIYPLTDATATTPAEPGGFGPIGPGPVTGPVHASLVERFPPVSGAASDGPIPGLLERGVLRLGRYRIEPGPEDWVLAEVGERTAVLRGANEPGSATIASALVVGTDGATTERAILIEAELRAQGIGLAWQEAPCDGVSGFLKDRLDGNPDRPKCLYARRVSFGEHSESGVLRRALAMSERLRLSMRNWDAIEVHYSEYHRGTMLSITMVAPAGAYGGETGARRFTRDLADAAGGSTLSSRKQFTMLPALPGGG